MSDQILSPTSIHPALSAASSQPAPSPFPKSDATFNSNNLSPPRTNSERPRTSSSASTAHQITGPSHLLAQLASPSSLPLPLSLQNLSLDEAKQSFRHGDHTQPVSLAAALVEGNTDSEAIPDPSPYRQPHCRNRSIESVPRQTLIKALASSVSRNHKPEALSLPSMLTPATNPDDNKSTTTNNNTTTVLRSANGSAQLCDALNDLAQRTMTPTTAFPALQSPCFYHNRFDGIVDIDKVLEEIKNDEWMSHSRLVQTATGVREVSKQLQRRPIKRAVRNVMIVTKARDNTLVVLTRELTQWLMHTPRYGSDLGVNVYVDAKLRNSKRFNAQGLIDENPRFQHMLKYWTPDLCWSQPEKFDLVLTLGGDGTVLFTSWLFQRIVPPVLSFSLGSLGFLTTFEYHRFRDHLNRVMGDDGMKINLRMRFTCTVYRDGMMGRDMEEGEQFEVLNELVIDRGPSPYVSNLELYGDNELLTVVQADGCIFSTPTGKFFSQFHIICEEISYANNCRRIYCILPLSRRFARPPRHPRHSPHAHLPTHPLLPAHGPLRHDAPPRLRPTKLARHRVLRL